MEGSKTAPKGKRICALADFGCSLKQRKGSGRQRKVARRTAEEARMWQRKCEGSDEERKRSAHGTAKKRKGSQIAQGSAHGAAKIHIGSAKTAAGSVETA